MASIEPYEEEIEDMRRQYLERQDQLVQRIKRELLIPFCRRHRLTFEVNPYGNRFYTEDGDQVDEDELQEHIDDPATPVIQQALKLECRAGWDLFDQDPAADVTQEEAEGDVR